ncbi:MAG: gfo/Idh/MocA family oxidoreductase [Candidatus Hydrogenedens sp.]|nr:gfo/Idh/MocA family oxidoreductase [Candidatus Hydrogenedens sp.]
MTNPTNPGVSRRGFLRTASMAAAAAPFIVPAAARAQGDEAPSEKIRFGLIGCGGQGRGVMGAALGMRDTHVLAVCDVNRVNARKAKRIVDDHYGNKDCKEYSDYRELIARDDIDAVIIATPDHWHALVCVEAARARKDIYCEKPVTHHLREGRAVADTAKANNCIFQVGSMQRSFRDMKIAAQLVRNGYIGKIHHIEVGLPDGGHALWADSWPEAPRIVDYDFYVGPSEWTPYHPERLDWNWRWWMKFGGSQMMDWIGHHGDIAHMGMGWDETGPRKVVPQKWEFSKEKNNVYNSPAQYLFECTYEGGTTMSVGSQSSMSQLFRDRQDTGTLWYGENDQWVYVSRGGLQVSSPEIAEIKFKDSDIQFRRQSNHMRDFIDCIRTREATACPAEVGHRSASIGHLGKLACELGATIEWDPATERLEGGEAFNHVLDLHYRGDWKLEA